MFALNGHVQAVLSTLIENFWAFMDWNMKPEKEILKLSDGGSILLAWYEIKEVDSPLLIVLPGLSGTHDSLYCQSLIKEGQKRGYSSVVINFVGMAGVPLTVRLFFYTF